MKSWVDSLKTNATCSRQPVFLWLWSSRGTWVGRALRRFLRGAWLWPFTNMMSRRRFCIKSARYSWCSLVGLRALWCCWPVPSRVGVETGRIHTQCSRFTSTRTRSRGFDRWAGLSRLFCDSPQGVARIWEKTSLTKTHQICMYRSIDGFGMPSESA